LSDLSAPLNTMRGAWSPPITSRAMVIRALKPGRLYPEGPP